MKASALSLSVLVIAGSVISQIAHAQVVYSTIDPNATTYRFTTDDLNGINYAILNNGHGAYQSYADQFSPTSDFTLSKITFGVRIIPGNNLGDLNAIIYANDPNTNLPLTASPLAIATAVAPPGSGQPETVPLTTFDFSSASLLLLTGQIYWIALEPAKAGTDVEWGFTSNNTRGRVAENFGGGYHQFTEGGNDPTPQFGAFQIFAVPEPSTLSLLGLTALAFFGCRMTRLARR